jgi:hypothetical protein
MNDYFVYSPLKTRLFEAAEGAERGASYTSYTKLPSIQKNCS